jgi:putative hemolysin
VGVLAGAFGGAGIAERLAARFAAIPALEPYADALGLGLVVPTISYLSLIIGELVPKQIALAKPERVAALVARPMGVLARVGGPLVCVLTGSTTLVFRLLGIRTNLDRGPTELDIHAAVE